jgi:hypothetical protein
MSRSSKWHFPLPRSLQRIHPIPRPCVTSRNKLFSLRLGPLPNLIVRTTLCRLSTIAATLHIWKPSASSAPWGRVMPWWQGPIWQCTCFILKKKRQTYTARTRGKRYMSSEWRELRNETFICFSLTGTEMGILKYIFINSQVNNIAWVVSVSWAEDMFMNGK